ncbi:hypothetical protein A9Z64_05970 [Moraxella osloensis]|uniref:DNA translocase FtsK n=2 Tax=Faucicola osloensis TaxID=34062 RepID=A0A378QBR0_FAUOS|nr:FtsK/SpoIIIE domain-containing protein [Moraxella osloensis]AME01659.1 hypothetical protein AXE82_07735 [Moraxella osloensis]OBX56341.1 hypothetical protein A9Z64_05970 [Moraxella osloensis]STY98283.1 DNA translocase FtsK [Moraxella osloensis]
MDNLMTNYYPKTDLPVTAILYQQDSNFNGVEAHFAFFTVNAHFDSEKLLDFKQQVGAELLVGIVTNKDDMSDDSVKVADKIMWCEPDDVDILVPTINHVTSDDNFIRIDKNDFLICFENTNTARFISYRTTNDNFNDLSRYANKFQVVADLSPKYEALIMHISATDNFDFGNQEKISKPMEIFIAEQSSIFYGISFTAKDNRCDIATFAFWSDDTRPKVLPTQLQNQLSLAEEPLAINLLSLLASKQSAIDNKAIHLFMGYQYPKQATYLNLTKAPHLLMAGRSKETITKMLHTLMVSILMQYSPEHVRLMLIDSEKPVFTDYQNLPHLIAPINDRKNAAQNLAWCQLEMERRYRLISLTKTRNLVDFNQKMEETNELSKLIARYRVVGNPIIDFEQISALFQPLPRIVVIVSELKELMLDGTLLNEKMIINIAQKACAAGIHLILSTNYPSVDVITELIRANIPTRLSFEVNTKSDSQTILDSSGAELLTSEDMLFLPSGSDESKYLQPIFATQFEINQACEKWQLDERQNYVVTQSQEINELIESYMQEIPMRFYDPSQPDPLYDEVVRFIREGGKVSASSIQRKFSIGYNRAARLIDRMEAEGIVSSVDRSGRRVILQMLTNFERKN